MSQCRLQDFHGGIYPPANKAQATILPIVEPALPEYLVLPISDHLKMPSRLRVQVGDYVTKGQCLLSADSYRDVAVHAPSSGQITAIEARPTPHPSDMQVLSVVVALDGLDQVGSGQAPMAMESLTFDTVLARIQASGIVGLGGAGFPTAQKISHAQIQTLVINAAECEPYICADDRLMRERSAEIVQGIDILMSVTQAKRCLIGIEEDKPEAIAALTQALATPKLLPLASGRPVQLVPIPAKYPSGGEKQLIKVLTGLEVPLGQWPGAIGILCQNIATVYAIYKAVVLGEPLISRVVTLTGQAVTQPRNLWVRLGTPIEYLLNFVGFNRPILDRVILGGPLMGYEVLDLSWPVIKSTNCLLAAAVGELPHSEAQAPCIRCGLCTAVCPAQLLPQQLYWFARGQEWHKAEEHQLFDCIECGACAYVCPSHIPLVHYYRHAKGELRQGEQARKKSEVARYRFEQRKARVAREQAQEAQRRQTRHQAPSVSETLSKREQPVLERPSAASMSSDNQDHEQRLAALIAKIRLVQDQVAKAQERLALAQEQQLDSVGALEKAFIKQQEKLGILVAEQKALTKSDTDTSSPTK